MASIEDLVRPKADFDPETIAILCAALDEAWDRLLRSGSECTRCYARGRGFPALIRGSPRECEKMSPAPTL